MKRTITQPADLSQTALATFKQWLGISRPGEDTLLLPLLHSGVELCESFIRQMPLETGCEEILPASLSWQCLDTMPVRAITNLAAIAADGSRMAIPPDSYEIEINADGTGMVRLLQMRSEAQIAISFTAGIAPDWQMLPDALRHGIIRAAAFLYRDRDRDNASADPLPASIGALWQPWRKLRIA